MTRLTKHVREAMIKDLLTKRFSAEGEALARRSEELFVQVYNSRYNADTRTLMRKLKAKFHDAFSHYGTIECLAPGGKAITVGNSTFGYELLKFRGQADHLPFLNGDRVRSRWAFTDCDIGQALEKIAADQLQFTEAVKIATRQLEGALGSVTTAKQLLELWPESADILTRHLPVANTSNLPAVQFAKLTEAFGLGEVVP